ncbi:hypothetical protein F5141DRAFT_1061919 [Pisolithus sp. B1]|nr:hypothetical protein F5141DRAFT_1061919 [Pisolithus sp. B1]
MSLTGRIPSDFTSFFTYCLAHFFGHCTVGDLSVALWQLWVADVPFHPLHGLFAEMNISDATSSTITWTHQTTEESLTISHTPPSTKPTPGIWSASHSPTATLSPTEHVASITTTCPQKLKGAIKSSTKPALSYIPPIPHPTNILLLKSNVAVQGYYMITVGQEVGIFYTWLYVAAHTNGISGNTHKQCKSFSKAIKVYMCMDNKGCVRAVPVLGGPFWPEAEQSDSSSSPHLPSTSSAELWSELGELPAELLSSVP